MLRRNDNADMDASPSINIFHKRYDDTANSFMHKLSMKEQQ